MPDSALRLFVLLARIASDYNTAPMNTHHTFCVLGPILVLAGLLAAIPPRQDSAGPVTGRG